MQKYIVYNARDIYFQPALANCKCSTKEFVSDMSLDLLFLVMKKIFK